jgi:hypothetical protein
MKYFCNAGAGSGEMKLLENDNATGAESLIQQFSAESQAGITKETADVSVLDVSQSDGTCTKYYFFQHLEEITEVN